MLVPFLVLAAALSDVPVSAKVPANGIAIPMRLAQGKVIVDAKINGKGPFPLFLDTGAGVTVLDEDLVRELGLPATGTTAVGDPANPQAIKATTVAVERLEVGSATFSGFQALTWDRSALYADTPDAPRGVLGIPLFSSLLLTIDYPRNEVRLRQGALEKGKDTTRLVHGEGGIFRLPIKIGGVAVDTALDTGSASGLSLPKRYAERLKLAAPLREVGRGRTVNSEFVVYAAEVDGDLEIAGHTIPAPTVVFNEVLPESHVGSRVLGAYAVTIDQRNNLLRLEKGEVTPANPRPAAQSEYAGRYGTRTISAENGELYLQRDGGPRLKLTTIAPDELGIEGIPAARLRFVRDANGRVTELHVLNREGVWEKSGRE
jgi:predicted aspartyl protease